MFCPHLFEGVIVKRFVGVVEQIRDQETVKDRRKHLEYNVKDFQDVGDMDKKEYQYSCI
jgi:hypothetical protein